MASKDDEGGVTIWREAAKGVERDVPAHETRACRGVRGSVGQGAGIRMPAGVKGDSGAEELGVSMALCRQLSPSGDGPLVMMRDIPLGEPVADAGPTAILGWRCLWECGMDNTRAALAAKQDSSTCRTRQELAIASRLIVGTVNSPFEEPRCPLGTAKTHQGRCVHRTLLLSLRRHCRSVA